MGIGFGGSDSPAGAVACVISSVTSPLATLSYIASHPLASRRLLPSLARYGWWQIVSRMREDVEYEWVGGAKLLVRNGMTGATGNIYCGLHEFTESLIPELPA